MDEFMSEIKKIIVEQIKPFKYNQGESKKISE